MHQKPSSSHVLSKVPLTKVAANKLGVSVEYLNAAKSDLLVLSDRMSFMVSEYFGIPLTRLLNYYFGGFFGFSEELELLSTQKSIRSALNGLSKSNLATSEWVAQQIQDANTDLYYSDPLSTIALNVANEISLRYMDEVGLAVDEFNFNRLNPLPRKNKGHIHEFLVVNDSGKQIYYVANKEFLPVYVDSVYTDSSNFQPVFVNNRRRTDLINKPNKITLKLKTKKDSVANYFAKHMRNTFGDISSDPKYQGLVFNGYGVEGPLTYTSRHDNSGNHKFTSTKSANLLHIDKNIITIPYYPITLQSSGTNSRELHFRPSPFTLMLLNDIPGIYYGKK